MKNQFLGKLSDNSLKVGIVGLGYVGLPLVQRFLEENLSVIGFDLDASKIKALEQGRSYIEHIDPETLYTACKNKSFVPTCDYSLVNEADALILCVPTPLNTNREPELKYVINTVDSILPYMRKGQLLSLESTTYPGTTEEVILPKLEKTGFAIGKDVFLAYSPEREDPGNAIYKTKIIPKVCGGYTKDCLEVAVRLYERIIDQVVSVSSTRAAEMVKILENTFRAVNIALVNELKLVAERMDIDIFEVIETAATKPFGYMPFYPGPGLGGHCIPIDPFYLTWKAREYGISTKFIELAGEVNTSMPEYVVSKVAQALNTRAKPLKGSSIMLLGVAYKKNVDDRRESPALEIIKQLREQGAIVDYSDPHVPVLSKMRRFDLEMQSTKLNPSCIANYDCVLVVTDHDRFDWETIYNHADLIVDTRGIYKTDKEKVFRA